jgi:hypothetical protein
MQDMVKLGATFQIGSKTKRVISIKSVHDNRYITEDVEPNGVAKASIYSGKTIRRKLIRG